MKWIEKEQSSFQHSFDFRSVHDSGTSYIHPFKDFLTSKAPISTKMGPNLVCWTMNCFAPPKSVPFITMYSIPLTSIWTIKLRSPRKNHSGHFWHLESNTPRRQGTTSATCGAMRLVPSFTWRAPSWPSSIFMVESCLELSSDHIGWRWKKKLGEDTPKLPQNFHKERNFFISCWWNIRGPIFQTVFVGGILE